MLKVKHDLCPEITSNSFKEGTNSRYNLRYRKALFRTPLVKSVYHGIERISYFGPKIWDIVADEIKKKPSLNSF